jgi:hypothetical protein
VEVVARVVDVDRDVEHRRERRPAARREVPRRVQAGDGRHGHLVLGELVVDLDAENNPGDDNGGDPGDEDAASRMWR